MKPALYRLSFILVTCFITGIIAGSVRYSVAYERMIKSLPLCMERGTPTTCIKDALSNAFTLDTVDDVMNSITSSSTHESFSCHNAAHVIGDTIATREDDLATTIAACGSSCRYGCVHGAVTGALRRDPNVLKDINTICAVLPTHSVRLGCAHGLGHAFVELGSRSVMTSYMYCDGLENTDLEHQCANGVFMELLFPTGSEGSSWGLGNKMEAVCAKAPQKYVDLCMMDVAVAIFAQSSEITHGARVCLSLPTTMHSRCINALGGAVFERTRGDVSGILAQCHDVSPYSKDCLRGAITSSFVVKPTIHIAEAICEGTDFSWKDECSAFAHEELLIWTKSASSR